MHLFIQLLVFCLFLLFSLLNIDCTYTHLPLLLLITFRYSDFSSTLGVHPPRDQEAQVSVHGVLGEQEGGPFPLP